MLSSQFEVSDPSGKYVGTMTTNDGIGVPLLIGPPYLPVAPIGLVTIFYKRVTDFQIDINIRCNDGYFMPLAIDSGRYKRISDSLNALGKMTAAGLNTNDCYIIVNGSKKLPLQVKEFFMGSANVHSYQLFAPIPFAKVRTLSIFTGNPLLDNTLKNMTFRRKKRLTYCVIGLS